MKKQWSLTVFIFFIFFHEPLHAGLFDGIANGTSTSFIEDCAFVSALSIGLLGAYGIYNALWWDRIAKKADNLLSLHNIGYASLKNAIGTWVHDEIVRANPNYSGTSDGWDITSKELTFKCKINISCKKEVTIVLDLYHVHYKSFGRRPIHKKIIMKRSEFIADTLFITTIYDWMKDALSDAIIEFTFSSNFVLSEDKKEHRALLAYLHDSGIRKK